MELYRWLDKLKTGEALFSDVVKSLVTGLSEATEHLTQQDIEAFQSGAQDLYDAYQFTLEVAQEEHALALERISQEENLLKSLRTLIDNLKLSDISPLTPAERLAEAQRQYASILAAVEGGDFSRAGELDSAAQTYLGEASSYYASSNAYKSIFNGVINSLEQLENQYKSAESYEERKEQLDAELLATQENARALLESQLESLAESFSIQADILTVLQALPSDLASTLSDVLADTLLSDIEDYVGVGDSLSSDGLSLAGVDSRLISLYESELGRLPTGAEAYKWQSALESGTSLSEIKKQINGSHFYGIESVPYDGYIATLHRGEKVVPAANVAENSNTQALIAEIRALRAEVAELRADQNKNHSEATQSRATAAVLTAELLAEAEKTAEETRQLTKRPENLLR
jgi:hypothetical protein